MTCLYEFNGGDAMHKSDKGRSVDGEGAEPEMGEPPLSSISLPSTIINRKF